MEYKNIIFEKDGAIATLSFHRPQALNALSIELMQEVGLALEEVKMSPDIRVLIVTGKGKVFIAGGDIKEMKNLMGALEFRKWSELFTGTLNAFRKVPIPVIAAVNGLAFGGGNLIANSCDMVIASDRAKFGQQEINVGIFGGVSNMVACTGRINAADICLTGRAIDAREAKEMGIVSRVIPHESLMEEVRRIADEMAAKNPTALRLAKIAIHKCAEMNMRAAFAYEYELLSICFASDNSREGLSAFAEGRAPVYR